MSMENNEIKVPKKKKEMHEAIIGNQLDNYKASRQVMGSIQLSVVQI